MKQSYIVTKTSYEDHHDCEQLVEFISNEAVCASQELADQYIMDHMRSMIGAGQRVICGHIIMTYDKFGIDRMFREFNVEVVDYYD